jgi:hypothetical protein
MNGRSHMRTFITFAVFLSACSAPSPHFDGGVDGGHDAGAIDAGFDAGTTPSPDECDFVSRFCDAGSCTQVALDGGAVAKRCVAAACDLVKQDCDGGLKCGYTDGGRGCIADGTLDEGVSCAGLASSCKRGLTCVFSGSDGGSSCARFCNVSVDCMTPQLCYVTLQLSDTNERPLVCANPPMGCSPLLQDCPDLADGCYPDSTMPGCFVAGSIALGATCVYGNDCQKGATCAGAASDRHCRQLCAIPSDGGFSCDAGACTRLTGSTDLGVCL